MTQRKVIIVPTIRAIQNKESKRVELVPFTSDETDLIVTYIRDPKAFLENNECETMTISMESLLSRKYTDQVNNANHAKCLDQPGIDRMIHCKDRDDIIIDQYLDKHCRRYTCKCT